ncbi:YoaK family protein [Paraburkholderia sp. J76]|uniref:YoaK family protein n=1 Tax=Paraburkholderia sp. J76 TaxID=2805439 RepID=UPI002ABE2C6A|nr:YoaK family protein [Paraburkholderia sp. J76]
MDFDAASRSREVAAMLTLSGGFLDAFTYVGHGGVFANTMTGNVALLGIQTATGQWVQAGRHIPPLIAFVFAVFVVHLLRLDAFAPSIRRPALVCLLLEIVFLAMAASGVLGDSDVWLIPGISFVATLQTLSFTHIEKLAYTSVMTTGNLRRAAKKLLEGLIPRYDRTALHDASLLGMASFCFFAGALIGAFTTRMLHDRALWLAVLLLVAALVRIGVLVRRRDDERGSQIAGQ